MTLTDEQTNRLADFVTTEVSAGRMTPEQGREYAQQTLRDAIRLSSVVRDTPAQGLSAQPDFTKGYVAQDPTRIAVRLLAEDGMSRAQIADQLERGGIDAQLQERIDERQALLLERHVETQAALHADTPDERRKQVQEQIRTQEALSRDARLAREYLIAEGVLPETLAAELTDQEAVDTAFTDKADPANDVAANLKAATTRPEPWIGESK